MNEILKSIKNFVSVGDREEQERPLQTQEQVRPVPTTRDTEPSYRRTEDISNATTTFRRNDEQKNTGTRTVQDLPAKNEENRFLSTAEKMRYADEVNIPEFMQQPLKTSRPPFQETKAYEGSTPLRNQERFSSTISKAYPTAATNTRAEDPRSASRNQTAPSHPQFFSSDASVDRPNIKATFQNFASTVEELASPKSVSLQPSTSQTGLDAMILEAIQRAVSTWIDQHMQAIVEGIVQREITKITQEILTKR